MNQTRGVDEVLRNQRYSEACVGRKDFAQHTDPDRWGIAAGLVVLVCVLGAFIMGPPARAQQAHLPALFSRGADVVMPNGSVATILLVHGEWIQVEPPDRLTTRVSGNRALESHRITDWWIHVPSGNVWKDTR